MAEDHGGALSLLLSLIITLSWAHLISTNWYIERIHIFCKENKPQNHEEILSFKVHIVFYGSE